MKKMLTLVLPLCLMGVVAHAQSIGPSTLNAAGGAAEIAGNTYEYSIGEMSAVHTASASGIIVTHGVLQQNKSTTGIKALSLSGLASVYPNPT